MPADRAVTLRFGFPDDSAALARLAAAAAAAAVAAAVAAPGRLTSELPATLIGSADAAV
jgi:hypothetical protein